MECPSCGTELPPEADFCMKCGARRPEAPAPVTQAEPAKGPASAKGSRGKWVAVGCIAALAVALVLGGLIGCLLLGLLSQSQGPMLTLPGVPGGEPTATPRPTPTWLPAPPPTPARPPAAPTVVPEPTVAPAIVMPYWSAIGESPVHVQKDQPVIVYWGWLATTPEYVQDFLDTATVVVTLDGEEVKPDTQSDIHYDSEEQGYAVDWSTEVGTLTPGTHRLDYHVTWSRKISDGWDTYGPGGDYEEEQDYCEIIVE
jgi:hypothetical protein